MCIRDSYMFRVMVMLGGYFILFFIVVLFLAYKKDLSRMPWTVSYTHLASTSRLMTTPSMGEVMVA